MAIEYDQLGNVIQGDQGDLPLTGRSSSRPIGVINPPVVEFGEREVPGVPEVPHCLKWLKFQVLEVPMYRTFATPLFLFKNSIQ